MNNARFRAGAFSLVEVTLALGVAAIALLAIFGLLPVGINNNQASIQQTAATNIATGIIADLKQVPSAAAIAANGALTTISPQYHIDITNCPPPPANPTTIYLDQSGGLVTSKTDPKARYWATIVLIQPSSQPSSPTRTATFGNIKIGWPAAGSLGYVSVFVALDRN